MRYTPTLKLSTRLVAFVTVIVISAMFILFIGGTLSIKRIGHDYLNHYLEGIVDVVDKEMSDPEAASSMQRWMPKLLKASNIVEMKLSSTAGVVYRFKDTASNVPKERLFSRDFELERNSGYQINLKAVPPYFDVSYSFSTLWSITLAVVLVIFCLMRGVKWLKEQLHGSELLEERGRMILAGRVEQHAKGDLREWPFTASEALDVLIEELQDARQERSRFDTFIRTQTFLDQLTGTANRVLFDNKLESTLSEAGAHGGVMLLRIDDWDDIHDESGKKAADDFVVEVGEGLSNILQRYPDVMLSRYYDSDFAIFAPSLGTKEIGALAASCLKQLEKIVPPEPLEPDNWCHVGVTMFQEGERQGKILDEAETALKSAQLQRINTWTRYQKEANPTHERGSVRWRTLFDKALCPSKLYIFEQPCYLIGENRSKSLLHHELFARIDDPDAGVIKASRFSSAIETVGYQTILDKAVFSLIVKFLKASNNRLCYSINLYVVPFAEKKYVRWFRDELLQLPMETRRRLTFELSESSLVKHLDYMRPVVKMVAGMGCKVCVGQAGRSIVSTHYLKDLEIDYLKLHRSLIKQIDRRDENQLFVRSLLGASAGTKTKVIAVGVDTRQERNTLLDLGIQGVQGRFYQPEQQLIPKIEQQTAEIKPVQKVTIGRRNRWRKK